MKRSILFALILTVFCISAFAQTDDFSSRRLDNLANQLKHTTVDLSDRTYNDLRRGNSNSRREVEAAFLAQQFDASAGLFQLMVRDNRSASELRDAVSLLLEIVRRAPNFGSNNSLWRDARNTLDDIDRELGGRSGGGNNGNSDGNASGRAFWRGTVDNKVQLIIKGRDIETRTMEGRAYAAGTFSFTSALPSRNVNIDVTKKRGRGKIRILQQPDRNNQYTAVIEIYDDGGGAGEYQLEISW